jgi:hypothetical protein
VADLAAVDGMHLGDGRMQRCVAGQQVVGHRHRLQRVAQLMGQHRQEFDLANAGRFGGSLQVARIESCQHEVLIGIPQLLHQHRRCLRVVVLPGLRLDGAAELADGGAQRSYFAFVQRLPHSGRRRVAVVA